MRSRVTSSIFVCLFVCCRLPSGIAIRITTTGLESLTAHPRPHRITGLALEEVKFLQKQRERKSGIPAIPIVQTANVAPKQSEKNEGDGEKEELVLQDTFAQETAVMVEDPNMLKYVEQELAKKRGKQIDATNQVENDLKRAEDELYVIPEHLKVKKRNSEESSTQWTTGIAEIQLPIEFKLRNIEETEAAKKLLQEKRLVGRTKTELSIPSSYSADYFQRGRDYAEKLRREHPELYKDKSSQDKDAGTRPADTANTDAAGRRQAATDEFMLERFRRRERHRGMRSEDESDAEGWAIKNSPYDVADHRIQNSCNAICIQWISEGGMILKEMALDSIFGWRLGDASHALNSEGPGTVLSDEKRRFEASIGRNSSICLSFCSPKAKSPPFSLLTSPKLKLSHADQPSCSQNYQILPEGCLLSEVFRFFFPLLLSTGICVTTVYEFILSGNQQEGGEISNFEDGNDTERSVVEAPCQRYNRFTFSMEDVCVEVGRVPLPVDATSMDGYVENESSYVTVVKVVLREGGEVERAVAENNGGYEEEEVKHISSSQQVHKFAEGVWNCYFGREIISDMDK
ncbi:Hepatocellular carcinoma-associated antigen 59 [Macleaya cordata]|uniref:Hepatocellular carcinoma-associated antigen 59 n=1 Tax=Macleaya cordata TaxID=56857 RepID=A0A200R1K4_MACCD|nr:Hepatocellular carcinoma-associated antigen 59 [Macleaya cordata]